MGVSSEGRAKLDYRKVLLTWVSYQLKGRGVEPTDFKSSFRDGRLYVLLLSAILPIGLGIELDVDGLLGSSSEVRAAKVAEIAQLVGLGAFISAHDVLQGFDRVNLVFVSQLLRLFPSIDTFTVLITRGIQNDYCGVGHRSPVHVGTDEAFRLFGTRETCSSSPLEAIVRWARLQPDSSFSIIHIRDVHRLDDLDSREHLLKFGEHCVVGTKGVQLVSNLLEDDSHLASNEHLIDVTSGISDTVNTGFEQLLSRIKERARGFSIRVGVIGVSTDFQINNLLFELQTRYGVKNLATCSALTAARTRRLHFNGLDNIERLLNVSVFHSVSDFTFWLAPNKTTVHFPTQSNRSSTDGEHCPVQTSPSSLSSVSSASDLESLSSHRSSPYVSRSSLSVPSAGGGSPTARTFGILERIEFDEKHLFGMEDLLIIDNLFRSSSRIIVVRKLAGGFSGAMVLLARSFDPEGHEQGPFVLKLGQIDAIAQERTNFERIEEIIGNQAPYIYASYEGMKRAGLKFAFASHCGHVLSTATFKQAYADPATSQEAIETIISRVTSALNRFYIVARMRPWDLLASYDFDGRGWALAAGGSDEPNALALRISGLLLLDTSDVTSMDHFTFGSLPHEQHSYYNVWKLMKDLDKLREWSAKQQFLVSFVHGDLNFSNILIDSSVNVWLIDFQYTTKAHYLKDLAKLENDAQMEVSLTSHEEFDQALRLIAVLHKHSPYEDSSTELAQECQELMKSLPTKLHRVCQTVLTIRTIIREVNRNRETDTRAYHITMLRYALHSMCFHQLTAWNRKWALANACSHAQHIVELLQEDELKRSNGGGGSTDEASSTEQDVEGGSTTGSTSDKSPSSTTPDIDDVYQPGTSDP